MLVVSKDELQSMIVEAVNASLLHVSFPNGQKPIVDFLSRIEVAAQFRISLADLDEWTISKKVKSYKIGKDPVYKSLDVYQALKKMKQEVQDGQ